MEFASFLMEDRACSRRRDSRERRAKAVMLEDARATRTRRVVGVFRRERKESIWSRRKESNEENCNAGRWALKPGGDLLAGTSAAHMHGFMYNQRLVRECCDRRN